MIHCFPSPDEHFFFHKKNIVAHPNASGCTGNPSVLGQAYYCKYRGDPYKGNKTNGGKQIEFSAESNQFEKKNQTWE